MSSSSNLQTFRDPAFSLWQSAVNDTLLKQHVQGKVALPTGHSGLGITAGHPYMLATVQAVQHFKSEMQGRLSPSNIVTANSPGVAGTVLDCAKLYAEIAWDTLFNPSKVPALKNETAYSACDPFWAECLTAYTGFLLSGRAQPYIVYTAITDYVLANCFPDAATIAIISDWGTGMNDAIVLLQQIAQNFTPSVLIHLGDIYYAGLPSEDTGHFTEVINKVWPENPPLVFTLDGNHDRYAGCSGGYYSLIAGLNQTARLPQPNSYFALRNNFWQFVAMDTGYHDTDPFSVDSNLTYLEQTEITWHLDKIQNSGLGVDSSMNPTGLRGTILLSHHQLMSAVGVGNDSAGKPLAINPNLAAAFAPVFPLIDFWLWGHEHNLRIFQPYTLSANQPLPTGRCVGAGAVPGFIPETPSPSGLLLPPSESAPPQIIAGSELGNNGLVFNHSYAIVTLNQSALTIDYYQVDSTDAKLDHPPPLSKIPFSDAVTAPKVRYMAHGSSQLKTA